MSMRQIKNTCLLFGEGSTEEHLFRLIEDSHRFKNRFPNWRIEMMHASGEACKVVLQKCINYISKRQFNVVLCFIDTDKLHLDHGTKAEKEKARLEALATEKGIIIIWQEDNFEAELSRATNGRITDQAGIKRRLRLHEDLIMQSTFIKRIFTHFQS